MTCPLYINTAPKPEMDASPYNTESSMPYNMAKIGTSQNLCLKEDLVEEDSDAEFEVSNPHFAIRNL